MQLTHLCAETEAVSAIDATKFPTDLWTG